MQPSNREAKRPGISFKEKFGVFCMVIASIYLIYVSIFPIIFNLTGDFNGFDLAINLIIFIIGIGVLNSAVLFARRTVLYAESIDLAFDYFYPRIEPVLREVASVQVDFEMMRDRLDAMNRNIEHLRRQIGPAESPRDAGSLSGTSVTAFLHIVLLANITLGVFIFLLQDTRGYTPYVLTVLYVVWWLTITAEYDLWKVSGAWTWAFVPILFVPAISILTNKLAGSYTLLAWMALGLVVYIGSYYLWGRYLVHEMLPFDLHHHPKINRVKTRYMGWNREDKQ